MARTFDDIKIDSEFDALMPGLTEEQERLRGELLKAGSFKPTIVLWRGYDTILSGVEDFRILEKHGGEFLWKSVDLPSREAAKAWIIKNELSRRLPTVFHRTELALYLEPKISAEAKRKQREAGGAVPQKSDKTAVNTRQKIAAIAEVSEDTVAKVKKVIKSGDRDLISEARRGAISIHAAYRRAVESERT